MSDTDLSITFSQANGASPAAPPDNAEILAELLRSIDLGQGEFSLLLVRCNYHGLQQALLANLREQSKLTLAEVMLAPTATSLYSAMVHQVGEGQPAAVSILGLNAVDQLDDVLAAANTMRESFRQTFPFPVLLWVDDDLLAQIRHRMPDFKSWGATTFRFEWDTDSLVAQLRATCDRYVEGALHQATFTPLTTLLTPQEVREAKLAMAELTRRQVTLPPEILGGWELHRGSMLWGETPRPTPEVCDAALAHYASSLEHWQTVQQPLGIGLAHFDCSLCHAHQGNWAAAKADREACLAAFATAGRSDLVARFVGSLGTVLVELQAWDELAHRLPEWQALHREQPVALAQDWSLQAEVAKHQQDWPQMQAHAEQAISIWTQHQSADTVPLAYCLQQAEALAQQGQVETAIAQLETARQTHPPKDDPAAFVHLLNQLRQLYFQAKQYRKAFEIKQERRGIQYQFQMRAFIGAGQLQPPKVADPTSETHFSFVASGRQSDIDTLVNVRVSEPQHKLTVLCGLSGVGKSSLVRAGLVPALKDKSVRDRHALTVVVRGYSDWVVALGDALYASLAAYPNARLETVPNTVEQLKAQLRHNAGHHLLTVLIFDQFEEFFFICNQPAQRQPFYAFLRDCLKGTDLQFVKVIFSLREDYLHELLEFEDYVKDLGVDFLGRDQRQRIENFTPTVARSVITELSQRTTLRLDDDLVEAMVASLTNELGRIRPVELQVVGAQLEAEGITTLEQYQELGDNPKLVLAERWVGAVVEDCGPENTDAAWQVLVALTNENGTRPLLTQSELEAVLEDYQKLLGTAAVSLETDLLPVLVGSGLVVRWPQEPEDRYQLVHDYLLEPIRRRYNADYRQQLEQLVRDKEAAEAKQRQEEEQRKRLQRRMLWGAFVATAVSSGLAVYAGAMFSRAEKLRQQAEQSSELATARQLVAQAERIMVQQPNLRPTAALLAVESHQRFSHQSHPPIEADVALRQAANRLPPLLTVEHEEWGASVVFSDDSAYLAISSGDGTAKLLEVASGREVATVEHEDGVASVVFSDDSAYLATSSGDGTAKLLEVASGREVATVEHEEWVASVVFSDDSAYLAISSGDGTAKLLEVASGREVATVEHEEWVASVVFSDDSAYLATSSGDGTAKLLEVASGREVATVEHEDGVASVVFSDDSAYLATRSGDGTAKLLEVASGREVATVEHEEWVASVVFSDDSAYLATSSGDGTAKLLEVASGREVATVEHEDGVASVVFSDDSAYLATRSGDGTAKLLEVASGREVATVEHEEWVESVVFSDDSAYLATSSGDGTAKLLEVASGREVATVEHEEWVESVVFSDDSAYLATSSGDGTAKLLEVASGREVATVEHEDGVASVVFSDDSAYLATSSGDGTAKLLEVASGREVATVEHEDGVESVVFSDDSAYLATRSGDGTAKLLEVASGREVATVEHEDGVESVVFSDDSAYLATRSGDGTAKLLEVASGREVATVEHEERVASVVFSDDSAYLATSSGDGTAKLLEVASGREVATVEHEERVESVVFSDDSAYLATSSGDGTAKLLEVASGREVATVEHEERVESVVFSDDSAYLATSSGDGTAKLLEVASGREVATVEHEERVESVVFSDDSAYLATSSGDGTAKLLEVVSGTELIEVEHQRAIEQVMLDASASKIITLSVDDELKLTRVSTIEARAQQICDRIQRNLTADEWRRYVGTPFQQYRLTCPDAPIHSTVLKEVGQLIAAQNDKTVESDEVRRMLLNLQALSPESDLYPDTEAVETDIATVMNLWQAKHIAEKGVEAARKGNIDEAVDHFSAAQTHHPEIDLHPATSAVETDAHLTANTLHAQDLVAQVRERIYSGSSTVRNRAVRFLEDLQTAQQTHPDVDISPLLWDTVCWLGALNEQASEVIAACETAVKNNPEHGGYRDSRGLARALTGDTTGAIEDFQAYIDWSGSPPRRKRQRQTWIEALEKGENPFTEDLLKELQEQ
jgi:WD40 repeat protein/DNA replication protein DnaC